jgi:5-methylcytosine-specific restriction endonuclease McrA
MRRWGGRRAALLTLLVLTRDRHICQCTGGCTWHVAGDGGTRCPRRATTADHWPLRRDEGGPDTLDNLRAACRSCNSADGARYGNTKRAGYPTQRM